MTKTNLSGPAIIRIIGQSLKQMRLQRNMSQDMLAVKAGVDRSTIMRMENGKTTTLLTLVRVLRSLDQLSVLDAFVKENEISPLQELYRQQKLKKKRRATPRKKMVKKKYSTLSPNLLPSGNQ